MAINNRDVSGEYRGLKLFIAMKRDPLNFFTKLMNEKGAYAWMRINRHPVVMLNDAAGIEHVLQNNSQNYYKGHFQKLMKPLFGESILLKEGSVWRQRRQEAAPVFAAKNFNDIAHRVAAAVEAMFKRWDAQIERQEPIDVTLEMTRFTLDAFLRALFHEERGDIASEMRSSLGTLLRDVEHRLWSPLQMPHFVTCRLPKYRAAQTFMRTIVTELIAARRAHQAYPDDLLSTFVSHFGASVKEQKALFDEVLAYLLAGHETTAHGLAWALYSLSRYPLVQQRVTDEVAQALNNRSPTMEDIKKLGYTRQVLDEVMRLFPPVWTMSRQAIFEDRIPLDEGDFLDIAPGDSVMMCHYAVHRREKYWPNPEAFDPERFTPEAMQTRPKFAWFPFGGGPRLCLGFRFAQIESLIALAMIHQRYRFSLISGQSVEAEPIITLRPKDAILFTMRKRQDYMPSNGATAAPSSDATAASQDIKSGGKCPFHAASDRHA